MTESTSIPNDRAPLVSVAMPVHNGEMLVARAIESILGQTYRNLELVISDNASTDGTEAICRRYAEHDDRVRYIRHERNLGAAPNFNLVFGETTGTYFKWASHDDELQSEYVERCVAELKREASVVLVHTGVRHVDEYGNEIDGFTLDRTFAEGARPDRFRAVMAAYDFSAIWGLMRRDVVARTRLIPAYCGSDRLFLAEMVIRGTCVFLPEVRFDWRQYSGSFREREMQGAERRQKKWTWWDPSKKAWPLRMTISRFVHGMDVAARVPMPIGERIACAAAVCAWLGQGLVGKIRRRLAPRVSTG